MDFETYALSKGYTDKSLAGVGAIAGKPCQIQSITDITGGHRVTFLWVDNNNESHTSTMDVMNGVGIKSVEIDANNHLIITYDDNTTEDAGELPISEPTVLTYAQWQALTPQQQENGNYIVQNYPGAGSSDGIWLPNVSEQGVISWTKSTSTIAPTERNIKGADGQDGADGLGVKSVDINDSNHLIVTYDDDTTNDAGEIDVAVPIDDTTPTSDKVYSSSKVNNMVSNLTNRLTDDELPTEIPIEPISKNNELAYIPDTTKYILLYVDDARASLSDTWEFISEYNIPLNVAVPTDRLNATANNGQKIKDLLHDMEDAGCEILSHSTDTNVLTQNTTRAEAYARLRNSKAALLADGFKVNGFIEPGGSGIKTFTEMGYDDLVRMFYLYSDTKIYPNGIHRGRTSLYTSGVTVDKLLKSIKQGQNARKFFFHEISVDVTEEYLTEFITTALEQGFVFTTEYEFYRTHAYSILDDRLKKLEKVTGTYKTLDAYLFRSGNGAPSYDISVYPYAFTYENGNRWFIASDSVLIKDKTAEYVTYKKSDGTSFNYKKFTFNSGVWELSATTSATSYQTYQNQNAKYSNYDIYDSDGDLVCGVADYYTY